MYITILNLNNLLKKNLIQINSMIVMNSYNFYLHKFKMKQIKNISKIKIKMIMIKFGKIICKFIIKIK